MVAGRGISLCPASAETFYARPGLAFVASREVPHALLSVAWRAADANPAVARFVEIAAATAAASGALGDAGPGHPADATGTGHAAGAGGG